MADGSISSPATEPSPASVRLFMPSVGDLIFIALLGLLTCTALSVRLLGDAGIGWHIRTGQQILAAHAIPRVDLFSSTMNGKPWFAWEWLYDVLVGWLEHAAGLNAVVLFTALIIASVFAWTFRLLLQRGTNVFIALVLVLLAAAASMIHFLARPHVVSWLFTLAWFSILDSSERSCFGATSEAQGQRRNDSRRLWLLPPLMLVWVNVHGGFLIGFALLGIYWAGAAWRWFRLGESKLDRFLQKLRARERVKSLTIVGFVALVATFANPYGWKLHVHIYQYLSNHFLMDHIDEFQSPNFHLVAQKCFAVLLLITLVALAARGRKLRLSEGLIVLFAVYAGLYASRDLPVSSLLLVLIAGPLLSEAAEILADRSGLSSHGMSRLAARAVAFSQRMGAIESNLRGYLWPLAAVAVSCFVVFNGGNVGSHKLIDAHFDERRFPVEAVNYLQRSGVKEPLLSPDSWGGYIIYRLYPQVLMVVDDRHDLYGEDFLKSYLKMVNAEPGWQDFLREYHVHHVLFPKGTPLANLLAETPGWRLTYEDDVAVSFEKPAAAGR